MTNNSLRFLLLFVASLATLMQLAWAYPSCTNNYLGNSLGQGGCAGSITYTHSNTLLGEINVSQDIIINSGVTLTTNGVILLATNAVINNGNVLAGNQPGTNGIGGGTGGANPQAQSGGHSTYGLYIQAGAIIAGNLMASGESLGTLLACGGSQSCSGGGGSGGGLIILAYNSVCTGCTVGDAVNVIGGSGGTGFSNAGSGGNQAGYNGGSTLASGGTGGASTGANGNPGSTPSAPVATNANIVTWTDASNTITNTIAYFGSGGGGGGASDGNNPAGSAGASFTGSYAGSGAGGGGISGSTIYKGGAGGNGQLKTFQYITQPLATPAVGTLAISPNPSAYGQSVVVTATCSSGDTCDIDYPTLGTHLSTGTTTATYTYNSGVLGVGSYSSYYANDITAGTSSVGKTLTVNKGAIIDSLVSCADKPIPFSCITTGSFTATNIPLAESQITGTLQLGSNNIGSTTSSSNSISDTESVVYSYSYTFSNPATANFLTNSITAAYNGYAPLYFQTWNTLYTLTPTNQITGSFSSANTIWYPGNFYTSSSASSVTFGLNEILPTGQVLSSNAVNIAYIPPANLANLNVFETNLIEQQYGNTVTIGANINVLNMTDIANALTTNPPILQYWPNGAYLPHNAFLWSATPTSWKLWSDPFTYTHANTSNSVWFTAQNTALPINILLTYKLASISYGFNISLADNPKVQTSFTLNAFKQYTQNTLPASPYTRQIGVFNTLSTASAKLLTTNDTLTQTLLVNNFTITNTTTVAAVNSFNLYIPASNYETPKVTQSKLSVVSTTGKYFITLNNYCSADITGSNFRNFAIYLPDTTNASLYTFSVYSGFLTGAVGDFIRLMYGATNASAIAVQNYQIQNNPFALALINGGIYSFRLYNSNCALVYATNYSIWTSPININIPINTSVPKVNLPNLTSTCSLSYNAVNAFSTLACSGSDTKNFVSAWQIKVYNASSLGGYALIIQNTITGASSFSYNYHPISNVSTIFVKVVAYIGGLGGSSIPAFTGTFNNLISTGFTSGAKGFLMLLFLLVGIGIGAGTGRMGGEAGKHAMSTTMWTEAFMVFLIWTFGLASFLPTTIIGSIMLLLIAFGVIINRYEGQNYYGG